MISLKRAGFETYILRNAECWKSYYFCNHIFSRLIIYYLEPQVKLNLRIKAGLLTIFSIFIQSLKWAFNIHSSRWSVKFRTVIGGDIKERATFKKKKSERNRAGAELAGLPITAWGSCLCSGAHSQVQKVSFLNGLHIEVVLVLRRFF